MYLSISTHVLGPMSGYDCQLRAESKAASESDFDTEPESSYELESLDEP